MRIDEKAKAAALDKLKMKYGHCPFECDVLAQGLEDYEAAKAQANDDPFPESTPEELACHDKRFKQILADVPPTHQPEAVAHKRDELLARMASEKTPEPKPNDPEFIAGINQKRAAFNLPPLPLSITQQPVEYASPEIAEGDLSEVESDLCEYLEGFERLSKHDCKAWASMIMQSVIRPHLSAPEREAVTLNAEEKTAIIDFMTDSSRHCSTSKHKMKQALDALLKRYELRRRG